MGNILLAFSKEQYSDVHFVCGFCNEALLLLLGDIEGDSPIDLYFEVSIIILLERGTFLVVSSLAERAVRRNVKDEENVMGNGTSQSSTNNKRTTTRLNVPHITVPSATYSNFEPEDLGRRLEHYLCSVAHPHIHQHILFCWRGLAYVWSGKQCKEVAFTHCAVEANFRYWFSIDIWCGVTYGQTIWPFSLGTSDKCNVRGASVNIVTNALQHNGASACTGWHAVQYSVLFLVTGLAGVGVHIIGQRDHQTSIHLIPMDGTAWSVLFMNALWTYYIWGHTSSHCRCGHIHQWPGHSFCCCCETGENMYRSWRRICWRFVTAVKVRDVEIRLQALSVLSCYNKRICRTHIIPAFLAHTCRHWEW
jgi:hypothetical protein